MAQKEVSFEQSPESKKRQVAVDFSKAGLTHDSSAEVGVEGKPTLTHNIPASIGSNKKIFAHDSAASVGDLGTPENPKK